METMLSNSDSLDFDRAVFLTENADLDEKLNYDDFTNAIKSHSHICKSHLFQVILLNSPLYA